jgi:hypothetical protein
MQTTSVSLSTMRVGIFSIALLLSTPVCSMEGAWNRLRATFFAPNTSEQEIVSMDPQVINSHTTRYIASATSSFVPRQPILTEYEAMNNYLYGQPAKPKIVFPDAPLIPVVAKVYAASGNISDDKRVVLPKEVSKKIWGYATYNDTEQMYWLHPVSDDESLLISSTLRSIKPVKLMFMGGARPKDITAIPGQECLLDEQLWYGYFRGHMPTLRLSKDTIGTEDVYMLPEDYKKRETVNSIFDGINGQKRVICGLQGSAGFAVFDLKRSDKKLKDGIDIFNHPDIKEPFYKNKNTLDAITLHPERNRFVLAGGNCSDDKTSEPYFITIGDLPRSSDDEHTENYALWSVREHFKKIIFLGKNTYVGCMYDGRLATIAHNPENKAHGARTIDISVKKVSLGGYADKNAEDCFKDIAIDNSFQTPTGFKPHVAFLNHDGMIFVTDLRLKAKPTLMLMKDASKKNTSGEIIVPSHLFYDEGKIGALYGSKDNVEREFLVWPDNPLLCLSSSSFNI